MSNVSVSAIWMNSALLTLEVANEVKINVGLTRYNASREIDGTSINTEPGFQ